ncbi:acetyl-CoA carboxylase carboxyltransferase subunit alpha [Desulfofundulus thermosubterraneus]|uniref:Acetyl-coenzyme A carboxylase carboxyl transferase subunit alpha n=1 Tax=Desulfofundulus thermosubterraneus DSM 16057 TaxID=1121432 RepID=A0A1M6K6R8_9FIRM|nr:acetyl-CoA carboxylase carboxyltransferase subunit alpha [Desulfofundulus thermosubterraneus]SHJ54659.1 acetyl-CoA carboxylase carboxyltransferase subunit alpha [Desulfofundulus thermosubterraneus DSM 16057]
MVYDFERPIIELEEKIAELQRFAREKDIDLSNEIENLEKRARELKQTIYGQLSPWQKVLIARHPERPNTLDYANMLCTDFIELHGDRCFGDDPAIVGGIARFRGRAVTVIGHLKGHDTKENLARNFGMAHPEGYRKALRLMQQAEKFNRPVLAFIDTPGAYPGMGAEERGQAHAIACCIAGMLILRVPVISVILGEGGSGGALALASGDRILMQEHAIFSVISPEAYATILWKDATRCRDAAEVMKITAQDLYAHQLVDEVIPEPLGGAHRDKNEAARLVGEAIARHLEELLGCSTEELIKRRHARFRRIAPEYLPGNNIT